MCDEPMFSQPELLLLSELLGSYLEIDDLNHREWADAKALSDKIEHRIEMQDGALDPNDKFFRG